MWAPNTLKPLHLLGWKSSTPHNGLTITFKWTQLGKEKQQANKLTEYCALEDKGLIISQVISWKQCLRCVCIVIQWFETGMCMFVCVGWRGGGSNHVTNQIISFVKSGVYVYRWVWCDNTSAVFLLLCFGIFHAMVGFYTHWLQEFLMMKCMWCFIRYVRKLAELLLAGWGKSFKIQALRNYLSIS